MKVCARVSWDLFIKSTADILLVGAAGGVLRLDIGSCEVLGMGFSGSGGSVSSATTGRGNGRTDKESGNI